MLHWLRLAVGAIALGTLAAASLIIWDRRFRGGRGEEPPFRARAESPRGPVDDPRFRSREESRTGRHRHRPGRGGGT